MADNITKTDDGNWKVKGLNGEELENSPYDTKKKAKQAYNAHKLSHSEDDGDSDGTEDDTEKDKSKNDNKAEASNSIMSLLSNKYVLTAGVLTGGYLIFSGNKENSQSQKTEPKQSTEESSKENQEQENDGLDSGRLSAEDVL